MRKTICLLFLLLIAQARNTATFAKAAIAKGPALDAATFAKGPVLDTATFAMGCFWCTQAKFELLKGVKKVVSGYTGGHTVRPSYRLVCTGTTGHAEACNIIYDPAQISYDELLEAFFTAHDPTQLNKQGNDIGTQYRSEIFYHNATQKQKATYYINKLNQEQAYKMPIVTQVEKFTVFYKADEDEQHFYDRNPNQEYCQFVIQPEVEKFKKAFANKLKP